MMIGAAPCDEHRLDRCGHIRCRVGLRFGSESDVLMRLRYRLVKKELVGCDFVDGGRSMANYKLRVGARIPLPLELSGDCPGQRPAMTYTPTPFHSPQPPTCRQLLDVGKATAALK